MSARKIRALENHVLPEKPSPAIFYISDTNEVELGRKAEEIRMRHREQVKEILEAKVSFEEKLKLCQNYSLQISPDEHLILDKDSNFIYQRIVDVLNRFFEGHYPETSRTVLLSRIYWVLDELSRLGTKEEIIDCEWNTNRDESNPNFDDCKWWRRVDRKVKSLIEVEPFSQKSWKLFEERYDKLVSEYMVNYWKAHPEEYNKLLESLKRET